MEKKDIKENFIESLSKIYFMDAFSQLSEFLQGELMVLYFLSQNLETDINPSVISSKLHISRPRITATLSTLGKKGYVTTKNSKEDRRKITVELTSKGHSYIDEKRRKVDGCFDLLIEKMSQKDILELIRLIDESVNIMSLMESELEKG